MISINLGKSKNKKSFCKHFITSESSKSNVAILQFKFGMRFRGPRLFRGLKLPELILTSVLGVLIGLYTWTPVIKEYKVYQDKYLEQQKKLQESGDLVAKSSPKAEEVQEVEEN